MTRKAFRIDVEGKIVSSTSYGRSSKRTPLGAESPDTVGPNGDVKTVEVLKSDTKNKKVDACVSDAFKKIKFPAPKNGATSVITFPISFGPLEEVK